VLPVLLLLYVLVLIPFTPSIADLRKAKMEDPSKVLSADGVVLAEFKRINRQWVPLDRISPSAVEALIATEDHRFYDHRGIDLRRTAKAALNTLRGRREGGSTITQQLARNMYPQEIGRSPTLTRKAKEAITALKIEAIYSKEEILETYLNTVPFLYNAFGIEMAARTYFDKSAGQLDVLESATLIGMLKGTSYYNPVLNPDRARERRNTVLAQMVKHGKLEPARAQQLAARPLRLDFERQTEPLGSAPHVAQQVRKWLIAWADREDYDIYADGLVVRTTLDSRLQKAANQAVARQMRQLQDIVDRRRQKGQERELLQAGFLAIDPRNGAVRPCQPGAPAARLHLQALRLRRGLRAGLRSRVRFHR
jgi:penicillin-binding protein 1A